MIDPFSVRNLDGHTVMRPASRHPDAAHWERLRIERREVQRDSESGRVSCGTCWRTEADYRLDLHHRHYDTWGTERISDVILLCTICHDAITSSIRAARHEAAEFKPPITQEPILVRQKPIRSPEHEITGRKLTTPERFNPFLQTNKEP